MRIHTQACDTRVKIKNTLYKLEHVDFDFLLCGLCSYLVLCNVVRLPKGKVILRNMDSATYFDNVFKGIITN